MATRKIYQIVKLGNHPLEAHFNIADTSTEIVTSVRKTELAQYDAYDAKDKEIEEDYQMVMDSALDMVDMLKEYIDSGTEARFLSRLAEVTGQQLNIALHAAEKKARLKDAKDKFVHKKNTTPGNKTVNNNNTTIIMDRNQMLQALMDSSPVIDVDHIEMDIKD
jgi:hypothetical protein